MSSATVAEGNHFSVRISPQRRFIVVLDGTWWMGSGAKFDPDNSVPMPTGTFVTHFGKQVHWDGAKNEDASLLIVGNGPGTSTPVEPSRRATHRLDPPPSSTRHPNNTNGAIRPALPA